MFSWVSGGLCLGGADKGLEKLHTRTCFVRPILWLALELWARDVSACDEMSRGGRGAHHPHLFPGGCFRLWSWRTVNSSVNSCGPIHRSPTVSPETLTLSMVGRVSRGDGRRDRTRGFSSCLCLSFACDLSLSLSIWTMGWDKGVPSQVGSLTQLPAISLQCSGQRPPLLPFNSWFLRVSQPSLLGLMPTSRGAWGQERDWGSCVSPVAGPLAAWRGASLEPALKAQASSAPRHSVTRPSGSRAWGSRPRQTDGRTEPEVAQEGPRG